MGLRHYTYNVLVAADQLANALSGGEPDETLSVRLGKMKRRHRGRLPRWAWFGLARPLDATLEWIEPGHTELSVKNHEAKRR